MSEDEDDGFPEFGGEVTQHLMTPERAAFVRKLRVERGFTWRGVAEACSTAWEEDWGSNQLWGQDLCYAAAKVLGEDAGKAPWN
jgi:hypothetical protein